MRHAYFCASICAKIRAAHSKVGDKVGNVPLFYSVREGGANMVRGQMEVKEMKLGPVKNWQDFVTTIMPFMAMSSAGLHRFGLGYPPYLFRGHTQEKYKLAASIFRDPGDKFRITVTKSFFKDERNIIGMVRNRLADYLNCSEWDLVAAAQHHSIPTRYLDWTSNPFVALAFAFKHVIEEIEEGRKDAGEQTPVIWVLKTNVDDFDIPKSEDSPVPEEVGAKTKIYLPNKVVGQVVAQDSYLMRQVVEKVWDGKNGKQYTVVPLDENPTFKDRLWDVEFDKKSFAEIAKQLRMLRIDENSLTHPDDWDELKAECESIRKKSSKS